LHDWQEFHMGVQNSLILRRAHCIWGGRRSENRARGGAKLGEFTSISARTCAAKHGLAHVSAKFSKSEQRNLAWMQI
jgi:hypothetical protein